MYGFSCTEHRLAQYGSGGGTPLLYRYVGDKKPTFIGEIA
jgi:hypothetical protein